MSETMTAGQIEAEAAAQQAAAREALVRRGRPPKVTNDQVDQDELPEKTTLQRMALNQEAAEARRLDRLRAARNAEINGVDLDPEVTVRVTKKGDGKISTGKHVTGLGDLTYEYRETPKLPRSIAMDLEERGFAEIQDAEA